MRILRGSQAHANGTQCFRETDGEKQPDVLITAIRCCAIFTIKGSTLITERNNILARVVYCIRSKMALDVNKSNFPEINIKILSKLIVYLLKNYEMKFWNCKLNYFLILIRFNNKNQRFFLLYHKYPYINPWQGSMT